MPLGKPPCSHVQPDNGAPECLSAKPGKTCPGDAVAWHQDPGEHEGHRCHDEIEGGTVPEVTLHPHRTDIKICEGVRHHSDSEDQQQGQTVGGISGTETSEDEPAGDDVRGLLATLQRR